MLNVISFKVASFTDAWIETFTGYAEDGYPIVASFTDAWIETSSIIQDRVERIGRIFYRCVD